jgi:hypothetical protein
MPLPDLTKLELDITYSCGMGFRNCDRVTSLAPCTPESAVTLPQLERLIAESVELRWPWSRWAFLGGEPTAHPEFFALICLADEYRGRHNNELTIEVGTHGSGTATRECLGRLLRDFPHVGIRNTGKTGRIHERNKGS